MADTVYKYFNWGDEARKILTHEELYFVRADTWKKSGEFDFDFLPLDREATRVYMEKEIWKVRNSNPSFYWKWINTNLHQYFFEDYQRIQNYSALEKELYEVTLVEKIINKKLEHMEGNPSVYENEMRKWYFKHTGIFSTSISNSSPQLWEWKSRIKISSGGIHQSVLNFNAVCVGFDLDKVKIKLNSIGNYTIAKVKYQGGRNQIEWAGHGDDFFIQRFNSIANTLPDNQVKDVLQQQEIRITKFFGNKLSDKHPDRYVQLGKDCITEVIVNTKAEQTVKDEVLKYSNKIGCSNVSVFSL